MNIDAEAVLTFQATLLSHDRFDESATACVTELALKLGFDRVSVGIVEHRRVVVRAVSHSTDVRTKYETNRLVANVMEEAVEQAAVVSSAEIPGSLPRVVLAHKALVRATGNQVFTVPLANNQQIYGAMTFERAANEPLEKEELDYCENLSNLLGPIMLLKWQEAQPWHWRIRSGMRRHILRAGAFLRWVAYVGVVGAVGLSFMPVQYNISAPAKLEGAIQRVLVAPENGFLYESHVRPGDRVKAGELLAELDDQELQLEKRKLESELAQHENAYGTALAESNLVQLVVNQSRAAEARAQLELVEQKISRARIVAPFDGVIISGDLRQSLGAPVQRGDVLLIIAPADAYRLVIEADERDIAHVSSGQSGKVALVSLPDKALSFKVQRITPVAATREGRNFFEVEAELLNPAQHSLRPGLEGVARIHAGQQPFVWIWTHRAWDAIRIAVWSWGL